MSLRVFRHVHRERSHKTLGGTVELPAIDAARYDAMLEAVAIELGLAAAKGRELYAAWVEAEQPPECDCRVCAALRRSRQIEQARLDMGAYRDQDGFWVFPNGLPDGEDRLGPYQRADGVWVHPDDDGEQAPAATVPDRTSP